MSGARILMVEDDPEIGELVAGTLKMEGHSVDVVHAGGDMPGRLADAYYDLVILDRMLPDSEGADLCRSLRAAGDDVLVLMLTARDALEDKLEGTAGRCRRLSDQAVLIRRDGLACRDAATPRESGVCQMRTVRCVSDHSRSTERERPPKWLTPRCD